MNKKNSKLVMTFMVGLFTCISGIAQGAVEMYVMKQDAVDFQYPVSEIDSIVFYNPAPDTDPFDKQITGPTVAYSDGATAQMTNPFFWIRFAQGKGINTDAAILTPSEIVSFNQAMVNQGNLRLTLPTSLANETTVTRAQISTLATTYGYTISTTQVPNFSGNRNVEYGIVTSFSQMTNIPTTSPARNDCETGLEVSEGVVIYYEYSNCYLVKSKNYFGWVPKSTIATCSKGDFLQFADPSNFVIVTAERLQTSLGVPTMLRMGTKLPIVSQNGNFVTFRVPTRTGSGSLSSQEATLLVDRNEYIHVGYLPYTTTNLMKQMFKTLGQVYGWGDQNTDRDCSSTLWTAYKCCGFLFPRNTGQMQNMNAGTYCKSVGSNHTAVMNALNGTTYRPGAIVLMSGHVTMYLGNYNGSHYIIHQSGSSRNSCKVTGLSIYNALTYIKAVEK